MNTFKTSTEHFDLPLKRTFSISRGSRTVARNVLIRLESDGITGIGEAAPNHRYDETPESAIAFLEEFKEFEMSNPFDVDTLVERMNKAGEGEYAARAGLEMALYDWIGKKINLPLYKILQAPGAITPKTTFTFGIDKPEIMKEKVEEAQPYPLLKIKLGTDYDKEIIHSIRELTSKPILVDANEGWTTYDQAFEMIRFMEQHNVYLIEQPMPADCTDEMKKLRKNTSIPLMADESFTGNESLKELSAQFHGINIKLMKTGAISTSLKIIHQARKQGLSIMVGCMLESAIADTASALVALWADYADLDGHLLVAENPIKGLELMQNGHIRIPDVPGLGLSE